MDFKQALKRFKEWQLNPLTYENKSRGVVQCANCGHEYSDNYCPRCGQESTVKHRLGWDAVSQSVMTIWGLNSRSLPYSLLQLLLRPGYLINDYIHGKRNVTFPPVKMLILVGVICALLEWCFYHFIPPEVVVASKNSKIAAYRFIDWYKEHEAWGTLIFYSALILPTWLLFHFSPKNTRHTLVEGFFIQVFMATITIIFGFIENVTGLSIMLIIIPIYFVITYKQLFGYKIWGTVWRVAICFIDLFMLFAIALVLTEVIVAHKAIGTSSIGNQLTRMSLFSLALVVINIIAYSLCKHTWRKRTAAATEPPTANQEQ